MPRNYGKLIGRIIELYGTRSAFAKEMGWSDRTCSLKLNGKVDLKQAEIEKACELLNIAHGEIADVFFEQKVQKM